MSTPPRPESLRLLEHEVGVLIRRVKRVIGQRSRAVRRRRTGESSAPTHA